MYTLKVLSNKEFDNLPYRYVKESLGCADAKTGVAYVRNTEFKELNLLTIMHEIDELAAKISPHEIDGIRYKKGKNIFKAALPYIAAIAAAPFTGGMSIPMAMLTTGAVAGGTRAIQGAVAGERGLGRSALWSGVAGSLAGLGMHPGVSAAGKSASYGSRLAQGLRTTVGMQPDYAALTRATTVGAGQVYPGVAGVRSAGRAAITGTADAGQIGFGGKAYTVAGGGGGRAWTASPGVGVGLTALSSGIPAGGVPPIGPSGIPGSLDVGVSPGTTTAKGGLIRTAGRSASIADLTNLLTNPMARMGVGGMSLASLPISPEMPDIGPVASKWLTSKTVTEAGKRAREIADIEYYGEFQPSKEIQAFIEVQGKDIEKAYGRRSEQLDKSMAALNPHWMRSGERLEMMRRLNEERQREVDTMQANWLLTAKKEHATRQYDYIMKNLDVDEEVKRDLLYADLATVLERYNMQKEDILNFRKIAADAGMYMLQKGVEQVFG